MQGHCEQPRAALRPGRGWQAAGPNGDAGAAAPAAGLP